MWPNWALSIHTEHSSVLEIVVIVDQPTYLKVALLHLSFFFNQQTGYKTKKGNKYLLPESFVRSRFVKASQLKKSETLELYIR